MQQNKPQRYTRATTEDQQFITADPVENINGAKATFVVNKKNAQNALKIDDNLDTLAWSRLGIHPGIAKYLVNYGLVRPTTVQQMAIKDLMKADNSLIVAAETGSGKTLAYLLPMISDLVDCDAERHFKYMIIVPTRELAIQAFYVLTNVFTALNRVFYFSVVLVGGLSKEKQERILSAGPGIVIGTPGRVFEMLQSHPYLQDLTHFKRVVIDEADRLLEQGHFADLLKLLQYMNSRTKMQITLNSATLNLPQLFKDKGMRFYNEKSVPNGFAVINAKDCSKAIMDVAGEYFAVLCGLGFKRLQVRFIDKTPEHLINPSVMEKWFFVGTYKEKVELLFYMLLHFSRPTLVFTNSINESKRLACACKLLGFNSVSLHAQMPQRQRLKNLDRLRDGADTILFTTDVCARGIDIPQVKLVIQFAGPNSAATHIHRIGRCVRVEGGKEQRGLAISLIEDSDKESFKTVLQVCDYSKRAAPKDFELDLETLQAVQAITETLMHAADKELEHTQFARKSAVFSGVEKMLDAKLEGDILDAADLKRYHEQFNKRIKARHSSEANDYREELDAIFKEVGDAAKTAREDLVQGLKRSILKHPVVARHSAENDLLSTNPRAIALPGEYKLPENMIKSQIANDIKCFDKQRNKAVAAATSVTTVGAYVKAEQASKLQQKRAKNAKYADSEAANIEPAAKIAVAEAGERNKGAPRKYQKQKKQGKKADYEQKDEFQDAQVVTGCVKELTGEAEMPLVQRPPPRHQKQKSRKQNAGSSRATAREGRAIVGELQKAGLAGE